MFRALSITLVAGVIGIAGAAGAASFAELDYNGDGQISLNEFMTAYPSMGSNEWTDVDLDGNGYVTVEEFEAAEEDDDLPSE